jgi:hypothetical protein
MVWFISTECNNKQ